MSLGIDSSLSIEALQDRARREAVRLNELRQISKRLHELLPQTLRKLRQLHQSGRKVAEAERLALTHHEYQAAVREYLDVLAQSLESRVRYESYKMLFQARQSLRRFHIDTNLQGKP